MRRLIAIGLLTGCSDVSEPVYLRPTPPAIEGQVGGQGEPMISTFVLPVTIEDMNQAIIRQRLAEALGLAVEQVPQARRDDYDVSLEWTIKNLTEEEGTAFISVVGANEFFRYDPIVFVEDPDEEAPPPPLLGGRPVVVPANGVVSGLFREEDVAEAAQDLDALSRAGVTPEFAMLTEWDTRDVPMGAGTGGELMAIPSAAVPAFLQMDLSFTADRRMVLEYVVRVRYRADRLDPPPNDPGELVAPSTVVFTPAEEPEE
jgi:hypothetical protein